MHPLPLRLGPSRRLALQAKKLYPTGRYGALAHKDSSGTHQIDLLDQFARSWGAVPAYLLYNHVDPLPSPTSYWHCCRAHDAEQLGCTLVPSWSIRQAMSSRGGRTFPAIHARVPNRPWRCVFDCDQPMQQVDELALLRPELQLTHDEFVFHRPRPDWLETDSDAFDALLDVHEPLSTKDLTRLLPRPVKSADEDPGDAELTYTRRILAVDVGEFSKGRRGNSVDTVHIGPNHAEDRGDPDDRDAQSMYGLEMSHELDGVDYTPRTFTDYDIDRLACAYQHPDFPQ